MNVRPLNGLFTHHDDEGHQLKKDEMYAPHQRETSQSITPLDRLWFIVDTLWKKVSVGGSTRLWPDRRLRRYVLGDLARIW